MFLRRGLLVLAAFLNEVVVDATEDHNSEETVLIVRIDEAVRRTRFSCKFQRYYDWTHVDDRGTIIGVSRSYLAFQSFTEFLRGVGSDSGHMQDIGRDYFGTATRTVCMYSESPMKCSFLTMSMSDRTERFPLGSEPCYLRYS